MLKAIARRLVRNRHAIKPLAGSLHSSFSQYGEDRIFTLLLHPGPTGTYVDVGSHHPYDGSNTFGLYLRGWRGLTIDPNPAFNEEYRRWRSDEIHLVEGVSATSATLTYHLYENSVFNSLSDQRAAALASQNIFAVSRIQINTRPLSEIVAEHLGDRQIDLLSVDCEGLDVQVLQSLDLNTNRPTVLIVEDYDRLRQFRTGQGTSAMHEFLLANSYSPIAQLAYSALYIASDYRELMTRSAAFDPSRIQGGILSG